MILKTTKKEMMRVRGIRKNGKKYMPGKLYFVAPDNKAYIAESLREMREHCKEIKKDLESQVSLL